jgi:xanthine/uracil permease
MVEHHSDRHRRRSRAGDAFDSIASSLAVGIFLSAVLTIIIGVSGIGHRLAKLFSPTVMVFLCCCSARS